MKELFTIEEFLIGIKKVIEYIGDDKLSQIIRDEIEPEKDPSDEESPDKLFDNINNF